MKDFRQLQVWQKSHQLTLTLYQLTTSLPAEERYGLQAQIRRACSSIPANLAEGCGRDGEAELARYCSIARGSASELEYHLLLARDLHLLQDEDYARVAEQVVELKRMLTSLIRTLKADSLSLTRRSLRPTGACSWGPVPKPPAGDQSPDPWDLPHWYPSRG